MQKLKVIFTNEIDLSVLDKNFYLTLLQNILELQKEKQNEPLSKSKNLQ